MNGKNDGLRQRKRHETRKRLETATISLVARDGLEHTTIEAISEKADVSPRTFFNYFDSKEDALLGLHNIELSDDTVDGCTARHHGDDVTTLIISLMVELIGPSLTDSTLYKTRRQLIKQYPQLLERQMSRMSHINERLIAVVQRVATMSSDVLQLSENEAEMLLALCSSSVRITIRDWVTTGQKISLPKLEQRAIQNVNEVLKKI